MTLIPPVTITPEPAGDFVTKARRVAESLRPALFFRAGEPWPTDLRRIPRLAAR
jgi:hypothetical protein